MFPVPTLRPYQEGAIDACLRHLEHAPILVLPTGAGKTVTAVALARRVAASVLWVAHRRELIFQARDAIEDAGGEAGVILAGEPEERWKPFQVASVQTLAKRSLPAADLLVIDEAHHACAPSYRRLTDHYKRRIGLTATPFRLDGKGLGAAGFGEIVVGTYADDLCREGFLHEPVVYAYQPPDLAGVKVVAGEYQIGALEQRMAAEGLVGNVVDTWRQRADGRRTVVFAVGVAHAHALAERFQGAGVAAEVVTGSTPKVEREGTLARLAAGATRVVVNCMVLTEGWDLPSLEVASIARPTASKNLHLQMLGRIMRACEGKDGAIVLDHAGNYHRHGAVTDRLDYSLHDKTKAKDKAPPRRICPQCNCVARATATQCPSCGYTWPIDNLPPRQPEERAGELSVVRAPGFADTFDDRRRLWHGMKVKAIRIVRSQMGDWFGPEEDRKAYAIAASMFHARYGDWPLAVGDRLVEPGNVAEADLVVLRERWREIAKNKGWDQRKANWFVSKCETEARTKAAPVAPAAAEQPRPGVLTPQVAHDATVEEHVALNSRPGTKRCIAFWKAPNGTGCRCGSLPLAGRRYCEGHDRLRERGLDPNQALAHFKIPTAPWVDPVLARAAKHAKHVALGKCRAQWARQFCGDTAKDDGLCKFHLRMQQQGKDPNAPPDYYECCFPWCHGAIVALGRYCIDHSTSEQRRAADQEHRAAKAVAS